MGQIFYLLGILLGNLFEVFCRQLDLSIEALESNKLGILSHLKVSNFGEFQKTKSPPYHLGVGKCL